MLQQILVIHKWLAICQVCAEGFPRVHIFICTTLQKIELLMHPLHR